MRRILVLAALLVALPAGAVNIDWVAVGDPGNPADTAANCLRGRDCGSVPYDYAISKYEVTNAQYAEFLNAKAASDPLGLYNTEHGLGRDLRRHHAGAASDGSYSYAAKAGFENKPVVYVSFYDALRFANWLHNGQGSGDTETGAYTITADGDHRATTRSRATPGATIFLTSENEWYKAAYYSPGGSYFDYPTGTDTRDGLRRAGVRTRGTRRTATRAVERAHGRRRLRALGQPVRHLRPGRKRVRSGTSRSASALEQRDFRGGGWDVRRQQPRRVGRGTRPRPDDREQRRRFSCREVRPRARPGAPRADGRARAGGGAEAARVAGPVASRPAQSVFRM